MVRFARGGFVRVSTEISSQKMYYYNSLLLRYWIFLELVKHYCWIRKNKIEFLEKET